MTDQGTTLPEPLDLDAIRAEAASLTEDPEFERSLHIGGMEQDLARFVLDRVPALLAALDAARAEVERLHEHYVRAVDDAVHAAIEGDEARAALAALRGRIEDEADAFGQLAAQAEGLSFDPAQQARGVAYRLAERSCRNALELAAAPSETEEGR